MCGHWVVGGVGHSGDIQMRYAGAARGSDELSVGDGTRVEGVDNELGQWKHGEGEMTLTRGSVVPLGGQFVDDSGEEEVDRDVACHVVAGMAVEDELVIEDSVQDEGDVIDLDGHGESGGCQVINMYVGGERPATALLGAQQGAGGGGKEVIVDKAECGNVVMCMKDLDARRGGW